MGIEEVHNYLLLCIVFIQIFFNLKSFDLLWFSVPESLANTYKVLLTVKDRIPLIASFKNVVFFHISYATITYLKNIIFIEKVYGTTRTLYLQVLLGLFNMFILKALIRTSGYQMSGNNELYYVGLLGGVFALKVIALYYGPDHTNSIMGIPVVLPTKYSVWIEFILIQILSPSVVCFGHLSGILFSLIYLKGFFDYFVDKAVCVVNAITSQIMRSAWRHRFIPSNMSEDEMIAQAIAASLEQNLSRTVPLQSGLHLD